MLFDSGSMMREPEFLVNKRIGPAACGMVKSSPAM
jgi:hypothetical protein